MSSDTHSKEAQMQITALGTGAADAVKYFQTSFLLSDGKNNLLIDTGGGSGVLAQMNRFGVRLNDIQNVFVSHKHIDHIFGIFWILRFRGAAIAAGKAPDLAIYATQKNIAFIKQMSGHLLKEKVLSLFDSKIQFIAIDEFPENVMGDWRVQFFDIQSKKEEQWGCAITLSNAMKISFLGDEPYTSAVASYCANSDYMFHDAYCLEQDRDLFKPHEIAHSTVIEAAKNAQRAEAKNLILFHTEDASTYGNRKALYSAEAKLVCSGNVFVPDDGEVIKCR